MQRLVVLIVWGHAAACTLPITDSPPRECEPAKQLEIVDGRIGGVGDDEAGVDVCSDGAIVVTSQPTCRPFSAPECGGAFCDDEGVDCQCQTHSDCGAGSFCLPLGFDPGCGCVEVCQTDADCGADERCQCCGGVALDAEGGFFGVTIRPQCIPDECDDCGGDECRLALGVACRQPVKVACFDAAAARDCVGCDAGDCAFDVRDNRWTCDTDSTCE